MFAWLTAHIARIMSDHIGQIWFDYVEPYTLCRLHATSSEVLLFIHESTNVLSCQNFEIGDFTLALKFGGPIDSSVVKMPVI